MDGMAAEKQERGNAGNRESHEKPQQKAYPLEA
jgi:hypothetical protein